MSNDTRPYTGAEYLDSLQGEPLLPVAGEARWVTQRWHALAQGIMDAVVARMLEGRKPAEKQTPEVIRKQEGKIAAALKYADVHRPDATYLVGEHFSLADIAMGVAIEYIDLRYPHDWRGRHPRLGQWLAGVSARPSFTETRPPGMEKK